MASKQSFVSENWRSLFVVLAGLVVALLGAWAADLAGRLHKLEARDQELLERIDDLRGRVEALQR